MADLAADIHRDWNAVGVKFAAVNLTLGSAADGDLVAAVAGKRIRCLALYFVTTAVSTHTFRSDTDVISGVIPSVANGQTLLPHGPPLPYLETVAGEALNLLNGATACNYRGFIVYVEVN